MSADVLPGVDFAAHYVVQVDRTLVPEYAIGANGEPGARRYLDRATRREGSTDVGSPAALAR